VTDKSRRGIGSYQAARPPLRRSLLRGRRLLPTAGSIPGRLRPAPSCVLAGLGLALRPDHRGRGLGMGSEEQRRLGGERLFTEFKVTIGGFM
jgi:GNAT superfamily N-acetyltransferase